MAIKCLLLRGIPAMSVLLVAEALGQSTFTASLVNPGASSVHKETPFELDIVASFDRRLAAVVIQLAASGDAGSELSGRSADPVGPNGLTYISSTSQLPFVSDLPHDFALGPATEMLVDMDYNDVPGSVVDGVAPGNNIVIERIWITPVESGSLTVTLLNIQALTTEDEPDGAIFDTINLIEDQVTVTVSNITALTADAGADQVALACLPTIHLVGSASGGIPPYGCLWTVVQKPVGSGSVNIASPGSSSTSVTIAAPVLEGVYGLRLTVTDQAQSNSTDTVQLTVHVDHPADSDENWSASINEVTAYGACWRSGCIWPMPPNPVPVEALTRIGYLWRLGESYHYEPALDYPDCWQLGAPAGAPASAHAAEKTMETQRAANSNDAANASRSIALDPIQPDRYLIQIQADPSSTTAAWAVEERVPAGWRVEEINEEGTLDASNGKLKWGIFLDNQPRTLTYSLIRPAGEMRETTLAGIVSVDGHNFEILGDSVIQTIDNDDSSRSVIAPPCGPGILDTLLCTSFLMLLTMLKNYSKPQCGMDACTQRSRKLR